MRTDPYEVLRNIARERYPDRVLGLGERAASVAASNYDQWMDWYEMIKILSGPFSQKQNPNPFEPFDKPKLDLLEKDEVKAKRPSMWNIVFYNDDYIWPSIRKVRASRAPIPLRSPNKSSAKSC